MLQDPFGDPFRLDSGPSHKDIFRRRIGGAGRGPRKSEAGTESEMEHDALAAELEPEASAVSAAGDSGKGAAQDKVVLKNPRWEVEKVGFNEETDISVEVDLPEAHAHKTRVDFELFAKTPDGVESISKAQGFVEGGKAKTRIPVYLPQFKDEFGNLLNKVLYFFTAKHSQSDLLKDDNQTKDVEELADPLLESHILQDVTFATGKCFLSPSQAAALKALVAGILDWKAKHKEGKLAVFGHADTVGREKSNKTLSEHRAAAVYAFLVKDPASWESLYTEDKWGLSSTQELLKHAGYDPGAIDGQDGPKTQAATKAFQAKNGLVTTGQADAGTRKKLYAAFMEACNPESLSAKDFDVLDGKAHAGCSEFNRVEDKSGECAANRRVAVFLLKSTKHFPIQYPCKHGDIAPCKKQVGRKGERRTPGFGCRFYDKLVKETAGSAPATVIPPKGRALFSPHESHPFGYDWHGRIEAEDHDGTPVEVLGEPGIDFLSVESGKKGLVELHFENIESKDIYLTQEEGVFGEIKIKDPSANPLIVEITAKASKAILESKLRARYGTIDGPILTELGVVLLPPIEFKANYLRVEDPNSPKTKLTTVLSAAELQAELNSLYKSGAARWKISGGEDVTRVEYDFMRNGAVDLEPGVESEEEGRLMAICPKNKITLLHVHELRWSYFLTKSVGADDTVLSIKNYGRYLDFIGQNSYTIEDNAGNSVSIQVVSVDKSRCELKLTAPIGVKFRIEDSPALLWPLAGLSGNPSWVSDLGTKEDLVLCSAHELGHTFANFFDLVEKENIMFGICSGGKGLRHRPIPRYYYPDQSEEQWKTMREN